MVHKWKMVQIDYVLSFPQAPVEKELYTKNQKGFELETKGDTTENLLKIHKNLYGYKQAGRVWYQHMGGNLMKELGFTRSTVDK